MEDLLDLEKLSELTLPTFGNPISWDHSFMNNFHFVSNNVGHHACEKNEVVPLNKEQEKLIHAHFHLWINILSNYTFNVQSPPYISCISGRPEFDALSKYQRESFNELYLKTETILNSDTLLPFPNVIARVPLASIRFVSCGKRTSHPLVFPELLKNYDNTVCIMIFVLVALVPSVSAYFCSKSLSLTFYYNIVIVKILLEQRDSKIFSSSNLSWKCLVTTFLLLLLALNTTYKSKMIFAHSRQALFLYENFDDLVKQNFRIYTKSSKLVLTLPNNFTVNNLSLYEFPHEVRDIDPLQFHASSYINELLQQLGNNDTQLNKLKYHSSLLPKFYESVVTLISDGYFLEVPKILMQLKTDTGKFQQEYYRWDISKNVALGIGKVP